MDDLTFYWKIDKLSNELEVLFLFKIAIKLRSAPDLEKGRLCVSG